MGLPLGEQSYGAALRGAELWGCPMGWVEIEKRVWNCGMMFYIMEASKLL